MRFGKKVKYSSSFIHDFGYSSIPMYSDGTADKNQKCDITWYSKTYDQKRKREIFLKPTLNENVFFVKIMAVF
ncbi:MAG TPA: hypothetical protein DHM90_14220 [Clostridiaceae bacterium]|nr:hypothetical protein [Clostridiaceae bacterium]